MLVECVALLRFFGVRCGVVQFIDQKSFKVPSSNARTTSNSSFASTRANNTSSSSSTLPQPLSVLGKRKESIDDYFTSSGPLVTGHTRSAAGAATARVEDGIYDAVCEDEGFDWGAYIATHSAGSTAIKDSATTAAYDYRAAFIDVTDNEHIDLADSDYEDYTHTKSSSKQASSSSSTTSKAKAGQGASKKPAAKKAKGPNIKDDTLIGGEMGNWVKQYYDNATQAKQACIPPLYFQHDGHSRSIVGYEVSDPEQRLSLIVFDPSSNGSKLKHNLEELLPAWRMQLKRRLHTLNRFAYQLVAVRPGLMSASEREAAKVIDVTETHYVNSNSQASSA